MEGYIVLQHGSRSMEAQNECDILQDALRARLGEVPILWAHLQYAQPDLRKAIDELAHKGVRKIAIIPLFLFSGVHVEQSIPNTVDELRKAHPTLEIRVGRHIGPEPELVDIIEKRMREAAGFGEG